MKCTDCGKRSESANGWYQWHHTAGMVRCAECQKKLLAAREAKALACDPTDMRRRIVGTFECGDPHYGPYDFMAHELECGHIVRAGLDITKRPICHQCAKLWRGYVYRDAELVLKAKKETP